MRDCLSRGPSAWGSISWAQPNGVVPAGYGVSRAPSRRIERLASSERDERLKPCATQNPASPTSADPRGTTSRANRALSRRFLHPSLMETAS
jgi:hypothetical protein